MPEQTDAALATRRKRAAEKKIRKLCAEDPTGVIRALLETPFWPKSLDAEAAYSRIDDDTLAGSITVYFSKDGDAWLTSTPDAHEMNQAHRFRSELGGGEPIEAPARMLAERLNDLDVTADGRSGVVATYQLVAQALQ